MREIKFRVWHKIDKKFIYDNCYLNIRGFLVTSICEDCILSVPDDLYELSQYTGLKDKNGTDIYEGDIIEFDYNDTNLDNDIYEVQFREGSFGYLENEDNEFTVLSAWSKELMEVIGNIHENTELLNENTAG